VYQDRKRELWAQFVAIFVLSLFIIMENQIEFSMTKKGKTDGLRLVHSILYILKTASVMVYVWYRVPDDCLNSFNRIPTLKYSIFSS
jgi:NADH:ubiquinone oxidoreductase subunit 6 (subunit J)